MTKQEAIEALGKGLKLTHRFFETHEYITQKDDLIITEDGFEEKSINFWHYRKSIHWNDGWSLFNEEQVRAQLLNQ